jgi:hypothetical protein
MESTDLRHRFQFHPADADNTQAAHAEVRNICLDAAESINDLLPDGREKSLAITHLEEAMMWANAGIARADGPKE